MAIFRKINCNFWEDVKVIDDFTPEDRYFMLYLMTNPHTNQVGCYPITLRQMEFETGYNKDTILKLIKRFQDILKIIEYCEETKELFIKNWHKYNWTKSPKVIACILKEIKDIKNKQFKNNINTILIQYGYSIDTETQEEKEKEEEIKEEEKKEKQKDIFCNLDFEKCFNIYSEKCKNLIPLGYVRRNRKVLEMLSEFLEEIEYNFDYFEVLCDKANELKTIVDTKIDFKMMINNHDGIINGKYIKEYKEPDLSEFNFD